MERLQKVIAQAGICSRREAEKLILAGRVKVNNKTITELGVQVSSKDEVLVDNKPIIKEELEYYILNKPRGVVTTSKDEFNRRTVVDLIPTSKRIYPVGRLDYDTTGLLVLTNDGELTNILSHPSDKIAKVYAAKINGILTKEATDSLKNGVKIEDRVVKALRVKTKKINKETNTSMVEITINEGRNHQVKNMFKEVGYDVLKLKRERVGFLTLEGLKSGEYRKLTPKEIAKIYSLK